MVDLSILGQALLSGVFLGVEYAMISLGLTFVFGIMRVINLAHADFYTLGGYLTLFLAYFFGPLFGIVAAVAVTFGIGMLVDQVGLKRLRGSEDFGTTSMIFTLGLSLIIGGGLFLTFGADYRQVPALTTGILDIGGFSMSTQEGLALGISSVLIAGLMLFLKFTDTGMAIRATSADSTNARALGINVDRLYPLTFAIGVAFASAAGGLFGPILYVYPQGSEVYLVKAFIVTVMGGMGSVGGALLAALTLGLTETLATLYIGSFSGEIVGLVAMFLVFLIRPKGFRGEIEAQ